MKRDTLIGHWEGETLVLGWAAFNEKTRLTRDRQWHTEALHISSGGASSPTIRGWKRPLRWQLERLCLDEPASRRAWVKLYKQYERDWEGERKNMKLTER